MSNYSDPMKLFNMLKEQAQTSGQFGGGSSFGNPNILKLQKGKKYSLRLLWLPSDERQYPMINQYVHRIWDDSAIGSKDVNVICPTSQYDLDNQGFKACPICEKMSALYKEASEGSTSAEELYKKFKRTLRGYVPVYVVNGPAEDVGQVKILQYTISFKKYFDSKIFGITDNRNAAQNGEKDQENESFDESNTVGISAFMYFDPKKNEVVTTGHNFIITVGTKKVPINGRAVEMNDYKLDFSMKATTIDDFNGHEITPKYFCGLSKELHFDEDFYVMHDLEKISHFKMKYIDGVESLDVITETSAPKKAVKSEDEEEMVEEQKETVKKVEVAAPKKAAKKVVPVEEEEEPEESDEQNEKSSEDEDIDLDELLKDI